MGVEQAHKGAKPSCAHPLFFCGFHALPLFFFSEFCALPLSTGMGDGGYLKRTGSVCVAGWN